MKAKLSSILFLILIILICYGNILFNGFAFDDRYVIVKSSLITSFKNLSILFSPKYFLNTVELSYRPVVTFSYFIDYFLWGKSPFGYHLSNLLLHILNSVILFFLLCKVFETIQNETDEKKYETNYKYAIIPTLFFAIHPATTEAVNAISYREDLFVTLFLLLTVYLCVVYLRKQNFLLLVLLLITFFLALFSKETAMIFPLLLITIMRMRFLRKQESSYFKSYFLFIPILFVLIIFIIIRFYLMSPQTYSLDERHYNLYEKILNFFYLFNHNLRILIFPLFLRADYVFTPASQDTIINNLIYIFSFFLYVLVFFYFLRSNKIISFSLLWIFITLLPVSNFISLINPIADRYLYFPFIGITFLVVGIMKSIFPFSISFLNVGNAYMRSLLSSNEQTKVLRRNNKTFQITFLIVSIFILLWYSYLTVNRNTEWRDEKSLWESNLRYEPNSVIAYNGLALIAQSDGNIDKAIEYLQTGLDIKSNDVKMLNNLGVMYMKKGKMAQAIEIFKKVLSLDPRHSSTHYNLFRCYLMSEPIDLDRAKYHLEMAEQFGYPVTENDRKKIIGINEH